VRIDRGVCDEVRRAGSIAGSLPEKSGDDERAGPKKLPRPSVGESGRSSSSIGTSLNVTRFFFRS
jgi:hypothetical protein